MTGRLRPFKGSLPLVSLLKGYSSWRLPKNFRGRHRSGQLMRLALATFLAVALYLSSSTCFAGGKGKGEYKEEWPSWIAAHSSEVAGIPLCVLGALAVVALYVDRTLRKARQLHRPYTIREGNLDGIEDPLAELMRVMCFIQDTVVAPIDERLPGRPFEYDMHSFPFTPMVLVIGNHSSGKSTFINEMLGVKVQETGVAPTDDGFTILERAHVEEMEDGPTVLGCPDNRPFRELQRFGQAFSGHLRRKRVELAEDSNMPLGLQIVDTPGMIDLPANFADPSGKGRGYNFVEVVRWWAKRADLVLLLFDPDKPGTTGETLDVLTKSLNGLNHKFLIVLNKVDQLDNTLDFARAYGALGWALSKVINRKDIPQIYTMYNSGFATESKPERKLPLEAFVKKREEVIAEVLRAKTRHNDNMVTSLEEMLRQVDMTASVLNLLRRKAQWRMFQVYSIGLTVLGMPTVALFRLIQTGRLTVIAAWWQWSLFFGCYGLLMAAMFFFLTEYLRQFDKVQVAAIDETFEEAYAANFIHDDGEDYRLRWEVVKEKVTSICTATPLAAFLPRISAWEIARITEVLSKDTWYLRQLARLLRSSEAKKGSKQRPPPTQTMPRPSSDGRGNVGAKAK